MVNIPLFLLQEDKTSDLKAKKTAHKSEVSNRENYLKRIILVSFA